MKRKPLREQIAENQRGLDAWAAMHGKKQTVELAMPPPPKKRAPAKPSEIPNEHQEQVEFVKWFRMQHRGVRIFAVPNAAMRSPQLAAYLKAEGLSPGCPDLWIPALKLAIEFKRQKGGVISPEQKEWAAYLISIGWRHFFAYGCEDAMNKLQTVDLDQRQDQQDTI